jgi:hypothetical protein
MHASTIERFLSGAIADWKDPSIAGAAFRSRRRISHRRLCYFIIQINEYYGRRCVKPSGRIFVRGFQNSVQAMDTAVQNAYE